MKSHAECITIRNLVAVEVAETITDDLSIQTLLLRFWRKLSCPECGQRASCEHRDPQADLALLLRMRARQACGGGGA